MADEQSPSRPQPTSVEVPPAPPAGAPDPARNGAARADGARGPAGGGAGKADAPAARVPLSSWLLNLGAQLAFGLLLAVFLLIVLWATGAQTRTATGTAVLAALAGTFLARALIRWPLPKEAFAREAKLPPNVRPSDSSGREVVETVVFVVVLVLLLKSFAAEAFVIPTGSMAETLYGYQKEVTCPSCK